MNKLLFIALLSLLGLGAAWHPHRRVAKVNACNGPVLVGRVVLTEGVGVVSNSFIHAGQIVVQSVYSPDSLSEGARVSVYQHDEGVLIFWSHTSDSNPTIDEPEVHYTIWNP